MLVVTVRERGKEEHPFTFDKDTIVIGRLRLNDVILPKRNISKKHATLEIAGGEIRLTDLNSTNGTYLNGKRITEPVSVSPADKIFVGDYIIQTRREESRSAIHGKVAPLEAPSAELESRATLQDLDGSLLDQELEKLGVAPGDLAGPETQVIDPGSVPTTPPEDLDLEDGAGEMPDLDMAEPDPSLPEEPLELEPEPEVELTGTGGDEELFEIPLEEEDPGPARILTARSMPAATAPVRRVEPSTEKGPDLGALEDLLALPGFRDALLRPDGVAVARDQKGALLDDAAGFEDGEALAEMAERVAGFEGAELGVYSRRLPGTRGWLSLVFPPIAADGVVGMLRADARRPVPISALARDGVLSSDQARELVQTLSEGRSVLLAGRAQETLEPLLVAALGQLLGRPRYVALGPGVPRLGGEVDRERIELGMDYAVEEPEAFLEALDLLQPRWLVVAPCSGRALLALLSISVTAQVPLLAAMRLADPQKLPDVLIFADRREGGVLRPEGVAHMLGLANPLVVAVEHEACMVSGFHGVATGKDGSVTIKPRS
ncbi:MAG: FHA domain-containing protein [Deltaproteobacteria bacterium]|nr:FHA domain-containing protein [Deltaproteobacteria bacterium]